KLTSAAIWEVSGEPEHALLIIPRKREFSVEQLLCRKSQRLPPVTMSGARQAILSSFPMRIGAFLVCAAQLLNPRSRRSFVASTANFGSILIWPFARRSGLPTLVIANYIGAGQYFFK
ncbi:MAG: hypothetical protein WAR58_08305, partial [Sphingorhabdus sp.]